MLTTRTKVAIAQRLSSAVRGARRLGRGGAESDVAEVTRNGLRWRLDLREGIDLAIYLFGAFERRTVRAYSRLLRPGATVLDIGANIGAHTLHFARCVGPSGHVYAFEPTQFAFRKLLANLALNPGLRPLVTAEQVQLAETDAAALEPAIYSSWPLTDGAGVHPLHRGAMKSTTGGRSMTLDRYLAQKGIARVDLAKIDVDGHEYEVLSGWKTIAEHRPAIIIELAPYGLEERGRTLADLVSLLAGRGYRLTAEDGATDIPMDAAVIGERIKHGAGVNVLALPAGQR
jgi:FkbM family methyltransferase